MEIYTYFHYHLTTFLFFLKALFLMIREMTGLRTQYITNVINKMREHNNKLITLYNKHGHFNTNKSLDNNKFF